MGATIIKADKKSNKLLSELAKKLGGDVIKLQDDQFEDLVLGSAMTAVKTGEIVDRASDHVNTKNYMTGRH